MPGPWPNCTRGRRISTGMSTTTPAGETAAAIWDLASLLRPAMAPGHEGADTIRSAAPCGRPDSHNPACHGFSKESLDPLACRDPLPQ